MRSPSGRLRVGLVSVRFKLFDGQMAPDFPARMHAHAQRSAAILERDLEVVRTRLIEEPAEAEAVARQLADERLDAVVFAPAMEKFTELLDLLKEMNVREKYRVIVGGAVTSEKWAAQQGADGWGAQAKDGVDLARDLLGIA